MENRVDSRGRRRYLIVDDCRYASVPRLARKPHRLVRLAWSIFVDALRRYLITLRPAEIFLYHINVMISSPALLYSKRDRRRYTSDGSSLRCYLIYNTSTEFASTAQYFSVLSTRDRATSSRAAPASNRLACTANSSAGRSRDARDCLAVFNRLGPSPRNDSRRTLTLHNAESPGDRYRGERERENQPRGGKR